MSRGYSGDLGGPYTGIYNGLITVPANTIILSFDGPPELGAGNELFTNNAAVIAPSPGETALAWRAFCYGILMSTTGSCGPPVVNGNVPADTSANAGHSIAFNPANYTDGTGTHSYIPGNIEYPSVVDFRRFSGGVGVFNVRLSISSTVCGSSNIANFVVKDTTLTLTLPENITVSGTLGSGFTSSGCGTGTPTFSIKSGSLPPGLTLNSDGSVSGSVTGSGFYSAVIQAENYTSGAYCYGTLTVSGSYWIGAGGVSIGGSNIDDNSGVYYFDLTRTHDTLYSRFTNLPNDVAIPNPFVKTGFFGG